nr:proline racemase family protein [Mesorhizobium sp. M1E.F.Ca.ET.045.02.1.1]
MVDREKRRVRSQHSRRWRRRAAGAAYDDGRLKSPAAKAIVPQITGRAWSTGEHSRDLDPDGPLPRKAMCCRTCWACRPR